MGSRFHHPTLLLPTFTSNSRARSAPLAGFGAWHCFVDVWRWMCWRFGGYGKNVAGATRPWFWSLNPQKTTTCEGFSGAFPIVSLLYHHLGLTNNSCSDIAHPEWYQGHHLPSPSVGPKLRGLSSAWLDRNVNVADFPALSPYLPAGHEANFETAKRGMSSPPDLLNRCWNTLRLFHTNHSWTVSQSIDGADDTRTCSPCQIMSECSGHLSGYPMRFGEGITIYNMIVRVVYVHTSCIYKYNYIDIWT